MKGQAFNKAADTDIIRIISDNPGITTEALSDKCDIPYHTIKLKVQRLTKSTRVFRQKKRNNNGWIYLLYTYSYARNHHIPSLYSEKPEKTTLELQMMFNGLSSTVA